MKAGILLALALAFLPFDTHALTDQDVVGYWIGNNPGPFYNLEFEAYYAPDHAWEFRRLDATNTGRTYHVHKIGKWRIAGDSLYTKTEIAKIREESSGDTCCAYPGDYFADQTETYTEDGVRKMRFIFPAGRGFDTAFFAYASPNAAFTFPDLAGTSGISRPGALGSAPRESRGYRPRAFQFRKSDYRADGTLLLR